MSDCGQCDEWIDEGIASKVPFICFEASIVLGNVRLIYKKW